MGGWRLPAGTFHLALNSAVSYPRVMKDDQVRFPPGRSAPSHFTSFDQNYRRTFGFNGCAAFAIALVVLLLATGQKVGAETVTFDLNSGPGPNFSTFNSGNLFTLDLDGPNLRISKPVDDGSVAPTGFVSGGILSNFAMVGNFIITVDFTLPDFPVAAPGNIP